MDSVNLPTKYKLFKAKLTTTERISTSLVLSPVERFFDIITEVL